MTNSKILIKKVTSNKTKQEDGEKKHEMYSQKKLNYY